MLYNPNWDRVFTTAGLAAWLKTKPRGETYDYTKPENCLVTQYLRANGIDRVSTNLEIHAHGWQRIANAGVNYNFGAAYKRALKELGVPWWKRIFA